MGFFSLPQAEAHTEGRSDRRKKCIFLGASLTLCASLRQSGMDSFFFLTQGFAKELHPGLSICRASGTRFVASLSSRKLVAAFSLEPET